MVHTLLLFNCIFIFLIYNFKYIKGKIVDILAPDEVNFKYLKQIDKNIQPYIVNMKDILHNGLYMLISDSFQRAIKIHSKLPDLPFPFSQWHKYMFLQTNVILNIFENVPAKNYPSLIENLTNIECIKWDKELRENEFFNPFLINYFFSYESQSIIKRKNQNFAEFQKKLLTSFVEKIPSYKRETAMFAFVELTKIQKFILPENQMVFNSLTNDQLDTFLNSVFHNSYTNENVNKKIFDKQYLYNYLNSSQKNNVLEYFIEKVGAIDPSNNKIFLTLALDEINEIQGLRKIHNYLTLKNNLNSKFEELKPIKIHKI